MQTEVPATIATAREWDWSEDDWPRLTIHGAFDRARATYGDDAVGWNYVDEKRLVTFADAAEIAERWAAALIAAGIAPGDRVAVALPAHHVWPPLQVAISACGATMVGINTRYRSHELRHVLANARPRLVITAGDTPRLALASLVRETLDEVGLRAGIIVVGGETPRGCRGAEEFLAAGETQRAAVAGRRTAADPDDVALIQYTSGSTAAPKGVELSHDAVLTTAYQVLSAAGYDAHDRVYSALPFYHVGGSVCTGIGPFVCGATMVVPQRYDALGSVHHMIDERCTAVQGHAAMFTMQIDAAREAGVLDRLRLTKGWAAAPPTVMRRIAAEMGITGIVPVYGMSEFGLICAGGRDEPLDDRLVGLGWPAPGTDVRLRPLPGRPGIGEVEVRGRQMLRGYFGDREATGAALDPDGWLRTGDLAEQRPDGRIVFSGRAKDMIKPGGENVSASEVEEFLRLHPKIAAVAVIGIPHDRLGEAPAAVVQPVRGEDVGLASILEFCAGRIASFKTPTAVFVTEELPVLSNGKVDKLAIRSQWGQGGVSA